VKISLISQLLLKKFWKSFRKFAGYQLSEQSIQGIKSNDGPIMFKPYELAANSYFAGQSSNNITYNKSLVMETRFPSGAVTKGPNP